jgi:CubicO group peptidase (beta-lactamase class C family)
MSSLLALSAPGADTQPAAALESAPCPGAGDKAITNFLVPIRQRHRVPAMSAALVTTNGLVACGVVGVRKRGEAVPAGLEDQWHLGSDCKAMTATLAAKLVERGLLKWESAVGEVFPELAKELNEQARGITLIQLLSHQSGLRLNPNLIEYLGPDGRAERLRLIRNELVKPPGHPPGTHYEYSNLGYSVAGAMIEKVTGKTWEEAIQDEVFRPLGMTNVGFGGTGTPGKLDQPWGHHPDGQPVSGNGPSMDNPPVLSPAGRVHCPMQDWAKFIADQLRGEAGLSALLKRESYQKLHTPAFDGEYALGWIVVERGWGGGRVLNHGGDNTMNCANVWVAPRRGFAALVCVNQSGKVAFQASDEAMGELIELRKKLAQ